MLVRTYKDAHERTGLYVGENNARRHFRKQTLSIDLMLDDLRIGCTLLPDFWEGHPEIHDARLGEWLDFKDSREHPNREPMLFAMLPSGDNTFVLRPKPVHRDSSFGAEVNQPRKVKSESVSSRDPVLATVSQSIA